MQYYGYFFEITSLLVLAIEEADAVHWVELVLLIILV